MSGISALNNREFAEARKLMRAEVEKTSTDALDSVCDRLIEDALAEKGYKNFTGNTVTSYTCGLYVNGRLTYFIQSQGRLKPPIRVKLRAGEYYYAMPDYDGRYRGFRGIVDTNGGFGTNTAMEFLFGYKAPQRGIALVMTTGTEYSEFLETEWDKNVLTDTYQNARKILLGAFFKTVK